MGLECEVIEGVYGAKVPAQEREQLVDDEESLRLRRMKLTAGELGCTLSHLSIYRKIIEEGCELALVLEDDMVFLPDFQPFFERVSALPAATDVLLLGHNNANGGAALASLWGKLRWNGVVLSRPSVKP